MAEPPEDHHHEHDDGSDGEDEQESGSPELSVEASDVDVDRWTRLTELVVLHPSVAPLLEGTDHRVLSVRSIPEEVKRSVPCADDRFRALIYDYTNGRTLSVDGDLAAVDPEGYGDVRVSESASRPRPSDEEFEAAVDVLMHDRTLRRSLESRELQPYKPMPPLLDEENPDGSMERIVNVGLRSTGDTPSHRFAGVRLFDRAIIWDHPFFPIGEGECEPPPGVSTSDCPDTGTGGQAWVTVTQGGDTIWHFQVIRPAASSGTNGSGVELRHVKYRGRNVLYRAHVPILDVEYGDDGIAINCGPTYRDWQNEETCFEAPLGYDVIPGYRVCSSPAKTILDSGSDAGNFRGVAIYVQGQEVVLVSEMKAGWYRYISQWRLHTNGRIRPRFGFAGTANPCTCKAHHHHVYWRLDFDIESALNNLVEEYNDPPIVGTVKSYWHSITYETRRPRDPDHGRHWRVTNASTGEGYLLKPGPNDGNRTPFGVGDLWVLRFRPDEIDDGIVYSEDPAVSTAHLDTFRTPSEPVANEDVVLWYAAHFLHDEEAGAGGSHWVGPELIRIPPRRLLLDPTQLTEPALATEG